jgi:hypothetical protein
MHVHSGWSRGFRPFGLTPSLHVTLKNHPMSNISITLPDGSQQTHAAGIRPLDIASLISPRVADDAVVARVYGEFYDLTRPLEGDAML